MEAIHTMRAINNYLLVLILVMITGCDLNRLGKIEINSPARSGKPSLSAVQIINHQVVITGTNLQNAQTIAIQDGASQILLTIESKTGNQIVANTLTSISLGVEKIFNLVVSSAHASSSFTIDFSLCEASLNGAGFDCTVVPNDGDVLAFHSLSGKWIPSPMAWATVSPGSYRATGKVGIGTPPSGVFDVRSGSPGTGTIEGTTTTITGVGTSFLIEIDVGDTLINISSEERTVVSVDSDDSLTIQRPFINDPANNPYTIRKKIILSAGDVSIGANSNMMTNSAAGLFPNVSPKLEIVTGNTPWAAYSELVTIRHSNLAATPVLRQLGLLFKMSTEVASNESAKSGGMILETSQAWANFPSLHLVTQNARRLTVDSNGLVGVGVTVPTTRLQVAGVISPSADNTHTLGTSGLRFTAVHAVNGTIQTSDERQKKNIQDSDLGLEFISQLRPVSYYWKSGPDSNLHYGLIAQETETIVRKMRKQTQGKNAPIVDYDSKEDRYGMRYTELISPLIKSVQELYKRLVGIEAAVSSRDQEIEALKKENAQMKKRLDKIEKSLQARHK